MRRSSSAIFVAAVLVASLAACGSDGSSKGSAPLSTSGASTTSAQVASSDSTGSASSVPGSAPSSSSGEFDQAKFDALVAAAKSEGEVVIYSSQSEETMAQWAEKFEDEYGIKVVYQRLIQGPMIERMRQEIAAKNIQVDVTFQSPNPAWEAEIADHLATLDPSELPNLGRVPEEDRTANRVTVGITPVFGFMYNTDRLKPEDLPNTVEELATKPSLKDNMAIVNVSNGGAYYQWHYMLKQRFGDAKYEEWLRTLMGSQGAVVVDSAVSAGNQVAAGELAAITTSAPIVWNSLIAAGAPVAYKWLDPTTYSPGAARAMADGPHPAAAKLFVNWLISDEGLQITCGQQACSVPYADIPDTLPMPSNLVDVSIADAIAAGPELERIFDAAQQGG
ncbi:MAG: extracellular solute-binding protein [Ilumatobacteraceae bacterium]